VPKLGEAARQELLGQVGRDGFARFPSPCDEAFVERVLEVFGQVAGRVLEALGDREIGVGSAAGYEEIVQRSPGRWDIPLPLDSFGFEDRDMPWWPVVAAVLGDDAEHSFTGVVSSDPGSPAQHWHIDSPHVDVRHRPPHAMNVLVALHDIPLAMGPTEYARGSHRLTNHRRYPGLVRDELVYQHETMSPAVLARHSAQPEPARVAEALTAGSCLAFDDRLLHRGLANHSSTHRHLAYFSYRKKGYTENTYFEAQRSVFDSR